MLENNLAALVCFLAGFNPMGQKAKSLASLVLLTAASEPHLASLTT